jgi:hypothetical protein
MRHSVAKNAYGCNGVARGPAHGPAKIPVENSGAVATVVQKPCSQGGNLSLNVMQIVSRRQRRRSFYRKNFQKSKMSAGAGEIEDRFCKVAKVFARLRDNVQN